MQSLKTRILRLFKTPQLSVLATVTGDGKPWARYVMATADEDLTIRCATFIQARKVAQIEQQPEVHLTCGVTNPMTDKAYLQIQGRAVLTADKDERHRFWTSQLDHVFDGPDDPNYGVLVITPYRIEFCTAGSYEPEVWEA